MKRAPHIRARDKDTGNHHGPDPFLLLASPGKVYHETKCAPGPARDKMNLPVQLSHLPAELRTSGLCNALYCVLVSCRACKGVRKYLVVAVVCHSIPTAQFE